MSHDFVPLREALAKVGRELGLPDPEVAGNVESAWRELVGPALAAHTSVRSLRDGVCVVEVDAPAWATQLRYLEDDLVRRFATAFGPGVVTSIRVVVTPPAGTVS